MLSFIPNVGCPLGLFGVNCSAICHCSDAQSCHRVTGHCSGKCEKGYFKPHVCQEGQVIYAIHICNIYFVIHLIAFLYSFLYVLDVHRHNSIYIFKKLCF